LKFSNYKAVEEHLLKAENIVLSTHTNPDGDTLGSALGLYHFLKSKGIHAKMISPEVAADFISWMPSYDEMNIYSKEPERVKQIVDEADLIVHIDYNAFHRTGDAVSDVLEKATHAKHLIIDHHPNPSDVFDAYISDTSACSTAQLVYQLIDFLSGTQLLTKDAAECLYVGLITDTGSFSYGMADEKPYLIGAALVKAGIDDRWIHQKVYSNNTENRLKLLGYALNEKLVINYEEHWAYISLSREELDRYHYQAGDTEGLVNYALSVNGVVAAVLLSEKTDKIRLSFRSKDSFAVNRIAHEYFDGGGHMNAAGGNSSLSMDETISRLKKYMSLYKEEMQNIDS